MVITDGYVGLGAVRDDRIIDIVACAAFHLIFDVVCIVNHDLFLRLTCSRRAACVRLNFMQDFGNCVIMHGVIGARV